MKIESLTDRQLFDLCREYGMNAKMWSRKFASLLPEVERRRLYRKHGCYSIFEFAAKLAGMNKATVMEVLRVHRKLEDKPLLKEQFNEQGWSKLRVVANVATRETDSLWAEKVKVLPKQSLEIFVKELKFLPGEESQPETRQHEHKNVKSEEWMQMSFKLDPDTEFRLRKFQQKLEKERKETVSFNEVMKVLLNKAEEKPKKPRRTKKPTKTTRYIPAQIKHELHQIYQGQCAYPSCNKSAEVFHHPDRFAAAKNHNNIKPLCKEHHHLAHAGLIKNEKQPPANWQIREKPGQNSIDKKFQIFLTK